MSPCAIFFVAVIAVWASATSEVVRQSFDPSVFGAASASASAASRAASARAIAPCSKGGAACDPTCRKTGICIQSGTAFQFRETADCGDLYCNPTGSAAVCGQNPGSCVPNTDEIGCDATGVFPDLYDCHNVLMCTEGQVGVPQKTCADDLAYDVCTGYCDITLTNKTCNPVPAICPHAGFIGSVAHNDRLYYYCVQDADARLHPVVGRCSRGYFDLNTVSCTESTLPGCLAPSTSSRR